LNLNTLNLNILGKDNIVCVSLVNATMCLNSIGEPNVPKFYPYINKKKKKNPSTLVLVGLDPTISS
jgi:hypothetical protein